MLVTLALRPPLAMRGVARQYQSPPFRSVPGAGPLASQWCGDVTTRDDGLDLVLLGESLVMREVRERIETFASLPWHVRIEGPTGTGKRIAATMLHRKSPRAVGPFVPCYVNMMPDDTALDELVGHVRGAFTSAVADRVGAVEAANGGTLCFDELGTATPLVQRALLQLIDQRVVKRLGESRLRQVDVRIVFLTNVDLEAAVRARTFRDDLYWRLGQLIVQMPALAAHCDDIPLIASTVLARKSEAAGVTERRLEVKDLDALVAYTWPGNVRQLELAMEHYVALGYLPETITAPSAGDWPARVAQALERNRGNKSAVARQLGVTRKAVYDAVRRMTSVSPRSTQERTG